MTCVAKTFVLLCVDLSVAFFQIIRIGVCVCSHDWNVRWYLILLFLHDG